MKRGGLLLAIVVATTGCAAEPQTLVISPSEPEAPAPMGATPPASPSQPKGPVERVPPAPVSEPSSDIVSVPVPAAPDPAPDMVRDLRRIVVNVRGGAANMNVSGDTGLGYSQVVVSSAIFGALGGTAHVTVPAAVDPPRRRGLRPDGARSCA